MKTINLIWMASITLALGTGYPLLSAAQPKPETQAKAAKSQANQAKAQAEAKQAEALKTSAETQARVEAEYHKAIAEAHRSRGDAQNAVAQARAELVEANRAKHEAQRELSVERRAEFEAMREALTRAHRELRESSRELSEVNRELMFITQDGVERQIIISGGGQPVIGAILGDKTDAGVEVLGVSPNGPAERAGLQAGDVIVAVGGRVLTSVAESGDARSGLNIALNDLKAFEPVIVSVERGMDTMDVKVVPEVREPLTWQSVTRLPSVPAAPSAPSAPVSPAVGASSSQHPVRPIPGVPSVTSAPTAPLAATNPDGNVFVERIEVQELDRAALAAQIARMEVEIEQRGGHPHTTSHWVSGDTSGYEFYFGDMSELGDIALSDTSAWYGLPLTSGLRLAEVDPDLGEYFDTDRGVLVLSAKPGNALLLQAGDVVLNLQGTEVNSPADFMRALRELEPGGELKINIKRKQKSQTLNPVLSDEQARFFAPQDIQDFQDFQVIVSSNDQ